MFKDKVVIITGASSGIGKALAVELSRRGAFVVLAARNLENLEETKKLCDKFNTVTLVIKTDVSVENDCKELINKTISEFGKIDVLINNAGVSMRALFKDLELKVIRQLMDVNFWGAVYCIKYALPYLLLTKGSVVGVSSIAGYRGLPGRTGYSASKYAIRGFLETLRTENRKTGLHVLTVAPSFTSSNIRNTALTADGSIQCESPRDENKMMTAEEVARRICVAIEKRRIIINMTIYGKLIVWINRFFPRMMDKIVYNQMAKEHDSPFK
jgi:short-subunit dehydrogenase